MDFEKILHVARKNELNKKEPVKCLQTKFRPPTKEQREKAKVLSEGVQRFLARKEEEERQRQREAERRKQELLALRAKDPKANRRIQTMLKRTKSANKSVMEDAIDNNNTADTLAGPSQPDEDDYGFVSETSSQLYNKLIQKMYSIPSEDQPKFAPSRKPNGSNLLNTKERVKMALMKQEEEEKLPHKRKRKGKGDKDDEEDNSHLDYSAPDRDLSTHSTSRDKEAPKIRKPAPPPIDFQQLLKIAEQKQHEPIVFQPKEKKSEEPEVLMTKKQKLEYERIQEWKRKRELGLHNSENNVKKDDKGQLKKPVNSKNSTTPQKIPKLNTHDDSRQSSRPGVKFLSKDINKSPDRNPKMKGMTDRTPKVSDKSETDKETSRLIKERDEALRILKEKERLIRERDEAVRKMKEKEQLIRERDEAVRKLKLLEKSEKIGKTAGTSGSASDRLGKAATGSIKSSALKCGSLQSDGKAKVNGVSAVSKDRLQINGKVPQKDVLNSQKGPPPRALKGQQVRQFPPPDVRPVRSFPPGHVRGKLHSSKIRRLDSDEDEYDSELDDFIDDGDADVGPEDVSKAISEIFRYDKNRYSRYDDDDECMESNFAQISKEEFFSTKCGILEDLQDIQKEKAALARKKRR